jgi:hypothetical protein
MTEKVTYFDGLLESWPVKTADGAEALEYNMYAGETPSPVAPFQDGQEYHIKSGTLLVKTSLNADFKAYSTGQVCQIPPNTAAVWLKVENGIANYLRVRSN